MIGMEMIFEYKENSISSDQGKAPITDDQENMF